MHLDWDDKEPIYTQLRDPLMGLILDEVLLEDEAPPSVRQIASEQWIKPITASKALRMMVDEGQVEKTRGLGKDVVTGARATLRVHEKKKYLNREWPAIMGKIACLNLDVDQH